MFLSHGLENRFQESTVFVQCDFIHNPHLRCRKDFLIREFIPRSFLRAGLI